MAFTERSARARAAILAAASRRFADDGYESTTVRAIAADAGVDPSMVIRYFTSKADLFYAVAAAELPPLDMPTSADFAATYARTFVEVWEGGGHALANLFRAAPTHADAAHRLQQILDRQLMPFFRESFPDRPDIDQQAALVLSQTIGVIYCRYLLKMEPLASMSRQTLEQAISGVIRHHLGEA
ncbi:TetR family transcriptional regulator [Micromonospora chersina]|uniref:TetR/AcrR family transcriptional regulator n=1 Tax=Micromonospora chersina TaxID=47854 RepID=UPI0033F14968